MKMGYILKSFHRLSRQSVAINRCCARFVSNVGHGEHEVTIEHEPLNEDGIVEKSIINPLEHEDFFNVRNSFTLKDLFKARVHMGHHHGLRDPYMTPYLFGSRLGMDIIDLEQTVPLLQAALNFTAHIAFRRGIILFISRNAQMLPLIETVATECGEYSHCRFWQGGVFTNSTIQFGAVTRLPDLCIFLNMLNSVFENHIAVRDSAKMNIPTIAITDSNCDARLITYPVPGNDDSPSAIELYLQLFKKAILNGKAKLKEMQKIDN